MANKWAKIAAVLALLGIIISVVGTGVLYFIQKDQVPAPQEQVLTAEQIEQIKKEIEAANSGALNQSGITLELSGATVNEK